jgi:subtilisin family serine protease
VIVAVLDTSPGSAALAQAAVMARNKDNALMQDLAQNNVIVDWNRFDAPEGIDTIRKPVEPDHGIFVSGIIHRIAPHAEIHLLHVLDDSGIGHTQLMLDALDYCLALAHSGRRVIVNMSMYLAIPPGEHLWNYWFGGPEEQPQIHPSRKASMIDALDEAVEQRIDLLLDAGAIVVAAAGNDALRRRRQAAGDNGHPQPRLPADFDGVICVVATNREGKIAAYSNRADIPATGNCVATYGGEGVRDDDATVVPPGDPRDGMVSVYTNVEVPTVDGAKTNMTGWVYWSGTSFATPVISGIAANVVAHNVLARQADPSVAWLTPRQVLTKILDTAAPPTQTDPALGCPYVPVTLRQ